jgi:hypothetical protein
MTPDRFSPWAAELLALRTMLADRRSTLLDRLAIDAVDAEMELKVEIEGGVE